MITIKVNGKNETLTKEMNIATFLNIKELKKDSVVVMLNENIIKKERFETTYIKDKDEIEILRFVSGG